MIRIALACTVAAGIVWTGHRVTRTEEHPTRAPLSATYEVDELPLVIRLRDPDQQLRGIRARLERNGVLDSAAGDLLKTNPKLAAARVGLLGLAAAADMDVWTAIESVLGRGLTLGVRPTGTGQPQIVAAFLPRDLAARDRFVEQVHLATGLIKGGSIDPSRTRDYKNVTIIAISDEFFEARLGDALLVSNSIELMEDVVDAAGSEAFDVETVFGRTMPTDAHVNAWLDLDVIRAAAGNNGIFADRLGNPLAGFIFGGWAAALKDSDSVHAAITTDDDRVHIDVQTESSAPLASLHQAFANHDVNEPAWAFREIEDFIGDIRVARDWRSLFADRESILSLSAASGLVNFSTVMSTLLGEIEFIDEFLGRINGPLHMISAQQDFSSLEYEPTPKLPGFALVVPMDFDADPELEEILESAGLRTITIIGLDQSQKNQPSLMTRSETYRDVDIVYGDYRSPRDLDESRLVPVQYNFTPSIAVVDGALVIASTRALMHSVIDASAHNGTRSAAHDELVVDSPALAGALRVNLDELIANRMIEENESRAESERFFAALFEVLEQIDTFAVTSRGDARGFSGSIQFQFSE